MTVAYHLTAGARGNADLVRDDADRYDLVERLRRAFGVRTLGWCLMSTHLHIVVEAPDSEAAAAALASALYGYARRFNVRHGCEGGLRDEVDCRPKVGAEAIARAIVYDMENPTRTRRPLATRAVEWRWSCAREFAGLSLAGVTNVARARMVCRPHRLGGSAPLADLAPAPAPSMDRERVLAAAAETLLVPPGALAGDGRSTRLRFGRALFVRLGQLEGFSLRELAPLIRRSHSQASRIANGVRVDPWAIRVARTLARADASKVVHLGLVQV